MIYTPGQTATISVWTARAGTGFGAISLFDHGYQTVIRQGALSGGTYIIAPGQTGSGNFVAKVTGGTINSASCTVQVSIPSDYRGTAGRFRMRQLVTRSAAGGGVYYAYLDILCNALHADYAPASSCQLDKDGRLYAAIAIRDGVEIRRFDKTLAQVEVLGVLANAIEPSICFDGKGCLHMISNIGDDPKSASSTWERADLAGFISRDMGKTFDIATLPAQVAMAVLPDTLINGVALYSNAAISSRGVRLGSISKGQGYLFGFALDYQTLTAPNPALYCLVYDGVKWQASDTARYTALFNSNFRGIGAIYHILDPLNLRGWHGNDIIGGTGRSGVCITPDNIAISQTIDARTRNYFYDYWRRVDNLSAPAAEVRPAPPIGDAITGSTYTEEPKHILCDNRTREIHLTDGNKYWASSPDMGRTWKNRSG